MSDPLNELLIIGPLVAKIQVADILDWVSPLGIYILNYTNMENLPCRDKSIKLTSKNQEL